MKDEVGGHYYAVVNAIRSGRRAPSTVAAGDEPRVNCLQGHKIAAQGFLASVLRDEVRCATGPGRELRRSPLPRTPVNRATEKAGAVRSPGLLCVPRLPYLVCLDLTGRHLGRVREQGGQILRHELSRPEVRLLLGVLVLEDARRNHNPVPGAAEEEQGPVPLHPQLREEPDGGGAAEALVRGLLRGVLGGHGGHPREAARHNGDGGDRHRHLGAGVQDPGSLPQPALRLRDHGLRRRERGLPVLPRGPEQAALVPRGPLAGRGLRGGALGGLPFGKGPDRGASASGTGERRRIVRAARRVGRTAAPRNRAPQTPTSQRLEASVMLSPCNRTPTGYRPNR